MLDHCSSGILKSSERKVKKYGDGNLEKQLAILMPS